MSADSSVSNDSLAFNFDDPAAQMSAAEFVRHLFDYDPTEPLALRWRVCPWRTRVIIGSVAGYWRPAKAGSPNMIRYVDIATRRTATHRTVWLHVTGEAPPRNLGWKDGNRGDCRIENLTANPQNFGPKISKERRDKYVATQRSKFTDAEWSARLRRYALRHAYGITPEDYERMHGEQEGLCATCHQPETLVRHGKVEDLVVDHCHATNKVRGLLCHQCNNGLGRFKDDPAVLRRAADYIEHHQEQHFSGSRP